MMPIWVALRNGPGCRRGQFFTGEAGEPLFPVRLVQTGRLRTGVQRTSSIAIPFAVLADCISPINFQVEVANLGLDGKTLGRKEQREIEEFQEFTEDVYEDERRKREKENDPSIIRNGRGVFLPRGREEGGES